MSGTFFEMFIACEIIKSRYNAGKNPPIYFYRDKVQNEIDLRSNKLVFCILEKSKKSTKPRRDAMKYLMAESGIALGPGVVVCCSNKYLLLDKRTAIVP